MSAALRALVRATACAAVLSAPLWTVVLLGGDGAL